MQCIEVGGKSYEREEMELEGKKLKRLNLK
jgi:predicted nucleic-acid-binding Zn-ribbon protein